MGESNQKALRYNGPTVEYGTKEALQHAIRSKAQYDTQNEVHFSPAVRCAQYKPT